CVIPWSRDVAAPRDACGNLTAAFSWRRKNEIGRGHGRHIDMQIDPVEQRTRQAILVLGGAMRILATLAAETRIGCISAATWVHRRDQHEPRRIGNSVVRGRYRYFPGYPQLA